MGLLQDSFFSMHILGYLANYNKMKFNNLSIIPLTIFCMNFVLAHEEEANASHHFLNIIIIWFIGLDIFWKILSSLVLLGIISFIIWFMVNKSHE